MFNGELAELQTIKQVHLTAMVAAGHEVASGSEMLGNEGWQAADMADVLMSDRQYVKEPLAD